MFGEGPGISFNFDPSAPTFTYLMSYRHHGVIPLQTTASCHEYVVPPYPLTPSPSAPPLSAPFLSQSFLSQSMMALNDGDSNDGMKPNITMTFNEHDKSSDVYVQCPGDSRPPLKVPRTREKIEQFFPYQPPEPKAPSHCRSICSTKLSRTLNPSLKKQA